MLERLDLVGDPESSDQLVVLVRQECWVFRVNPDLQVNLDPEVILVDRDAVALMVQLDLQALLDLLAVRVPRVHQEHEGRLDNRVKLAFQEHEVQQGDKDRLVLWELQVLEVQPVFLVILELPVPLARTAVQVQLETLAIRVPMEHLD